MDERNVSAFHQNDLPLTLLAAFRDMREKKELCDITVRIRNCSFSAHRVILAAGIPFFRRLFGTTKTETINGEISLDHLDPKALESLINFAYSSKLCISTENVESLIITSKVLELNQVFDACVDFMLKRLRHARVLKVCTLAHTLNNTKLIESCYDVIRENFEVLSKSGDFVNLPDECLKKIISADDLKVSSEEIVFEAVVNWTKRSPLERHFVLPKLLREIRMIHLPINYLFDRVCLEELIRSSVSCRDLLDEVKEYHLRKDISVFRNLKTWPRKFYAMNRTVYAVCCNDKTSEHSIHYCDFINNTWRTFSSRAEKKKIFKVAAVSTKIYMFLEETIQTLDLKTLRWETLEPTHKYIGGAYSLSYRGIIYFFGSYDAYFSGKVRRFDTVQNNWLEETGMRTLRWGSAAVYHEESIFVTGGHGRSGYLCSAEKYNPVTGHWEILAPMLTGRVRHGSVSTAGKIYVCGGWTSGLYPYISATEVYNPLSDQWLQVSPMKTKKCNHSLISHDGKIYALGGFALNVTREIEIYDPEIDQWKSSSFTVPEGFIRALSIT